MLVGATTERWLETTDALDRTDAAYTEEGLARMSDVEESKKKMPVLAKAESAAWEWTGNNTATVVERTSRLDRKSRVKERRAQRDCNGQKRSWGQALPINDRLTTCMCRTSLRRSSGMKIAS